MPRPRRRSTSSHRPSSTTLARVHPAAAGIDCGAAEHYVAVPPDRAACPVQAFATFTPDLQRLAAWLRACDVTHVAMEATGVYWIPVFEILEGQGFQVILVNAHHVKHVPGRKSDVRDCEWLRDLHMVGLLRGSFRPDDAIVPLRAYLRHRTTLIESTVAVVQRMQKALLQMNVQLSVVLSDLTGLTGLRILRAIVGGERDPHRLAQLRDPRCHASEATIVAALTGNYRPEHLFALEQNLALYDVYQHHLTACDTVLAAYLSTLAARAPAPATPLPPARTARAAAGNAPTVDIRPLLHQLTGTDLSQVDGLGPYAALRLISEIGTDMTRWPTEKHFTAWLGLAPQNRISGGRLLSSRTPPGANRAAGIFRMAAMAVGRTRTGLGAFYRRLGARIGKAKAITATARKLAVLVYRILRGDLVYVDRGAAPYDAEQRAHAIRHLRRRANVLGFHLVPTAAGEVSPVPVS